MASSASNPPPAKTAGLPFAVVRSSMPPDPERHEKQLQAMMEIAWAIRSTLHTDTLLPEIMGKVTALMHADRSTFFVVDKQRGELWSKVLQADSQKPREIRLRVGDGIAGWVAQSGEVVNLLDAYDDPRFDRSWDQHSGYRTQSLLCVPIYDRELSVIAVIQCLNKRGRRRFDDEDVELLRCIGGQCAVALESAFLYQSLFERNRELEQAEARLRRAHAELEMLYDVEQQISEASDPGALVREVLERACMLLQVESAAVLLLGEPASQLYLARRNQSSPPPASVDSREARRMLTHAKTPVHRMADVSGAIADVFAAHEGRPVRETFTVPVSDGRSLIGLLQLADRASQAHDADAMLRMAALLSGQLSRGLVVKRERAAGEREERLALLGHSISALLHDLRTPMTAIGGFAELMAAEDDAKARSEHAGRIERALGHMETMTQEVLAFARGKREVLIQKVYMDKFVEAVREMLVPETERFGVRLIVHADYDGIARFDESKVKRVIFNLARNACQAMGQGGTFTWRVQSTRDSLVFECADTGPGIPKEMEGRLFESFATHGKSDGTGLGLAMAKKIIDAHRGTISCHSIPAQGATFRIELPF